MINIILIFPFVLSPPQMFQFQTTRDMPQLSCWQISTVNDRGPRYANFALLRLQDSLHSPFRKYKIWYLVHGSTVSCIRKRGGNPSPWVIIILNYNMATKYTRSRQGLNQLNSLYIPSKNRSDLLFKS